MTSVDRHPAGALQTVYIDACLARAAGFTRARVVAPMSAEDADDDLYADLVGESGAAGDTVIRTQNAALKQRVREQDEALRKLAKQLRDSEALVASLRAENETLERNISCLYRTAVLEIARKDKLLAK